MTRRKPAPKPPPRATPYELKWQELRHELETKRMLLAVWRSVEEARREMMAKVGRKG